MEQDERRAEEAFAKRQGRREGDFDLYIPRLQFGPKIPHYYGDFVRKAFIVVAALLLIFAPYFSGENTTLPFVILGAIMLVCFAALTSPRNKLIMAGNVLISVLGLLLFEFAALIAYSGADLLSFFARESIAVIFLFSLYFGVKTMRAMLLGTLGRQTTSGEFLLDEEEPTKEERARHIHKQTDSGD